MGDYDKADLIEVCEWMTATMGKRVDPDDFPDGWKSGVLLCEFANALRPGIIPKIAKSNVSFQKLGNIENFTNAA